MPAVHVGVGTVSQNDAAAPGVPAPHNAGWWMLRSVIMAGVASFEAVADEYDAARPSYPDEVLDALGPLEGVRVLDVGAGTGLATRALIARQAKVVAVDSGREVLRRATARTAGLAAVVADGAVLPVRSDAVDLVCFAQALAPGLPVPSGGPLRVCARPSEPRA